LNIAGIDYDLNNKSLDIFVSGCKPPHCPSCQNPELWNFNVGEEWTAYKTKIYQYIESGMVKKIDLMGGCPLNQDIKQLELLLIFLSQFNLDIWLWTRFQEEDIPENIKQYLSYAKVGEYICDSESYEEPLFGITLASANQRIIKIN
jgi:organic radical activating enzyme